MRDTLVLLCSHSQTSWFFYKLPILNTYLVDELIIHGGNYFSKNRAEYLEFSKKVQNIIHSAKCGKKAHLLKHRFQQRIV